MIPEIEQHRDEIIAICEEFGIERLYVFGSSLSPAFERERSDVDFLVIYPNDYDYGPFGARHLELKARLEESIGLRIDLIMGRNLRNPIFIESLRRTRQLLYAA